MYTEYWNLKILPFENAPDPRFFYESTGHKEAIVRLMFAIQTHKAMALISGDYGSGKTVLCETVMSRLSPNQFKVAFVTNPRMDALDLTREIAYQFGENIETRSKYDVLHAFNNLLDRHKSAGRHCAAIIDEAQLVTDPFVLEDLRLLLNHESRGQFLLTLVFVGQTELREALRSIPQMAQRMSLTFHIPHLELNEVRPYIANRLETAGASLDIFEDSAIMEVNTLSKGNPREINALCDMSLLRAFLLGKKQVTVEDIVDAANERV